MLYLICSTRGVCHHNDTIIVMLFILQCLIGLITQWHICHNEIDRKYNRKALCKVEWTIRWICEKCEGWHVWETLISRDVRQSTTAEKIINKLVDGFDGTFICTVLNVCKCIYTWHHNGIRRFQNIHFRRSSSSRYDLHCIHLCKYMYLSAWFVIVGM